MARVLVIDDNLLMRKMLRLLLEEDGYEVVEAANGRVGTALCVEKPPQVVLTDMLVPQQDGLETIRALRQADPQVKIIAMSARGYSMTTDDVSYATEALGALRVLAKPFSCVELLDAVDTVLVSNV
jgi:DNA-binding response OmpR family regulator